MGILSDKGAEFVFLGGMGNGLCCVSAGSSQRNTNSTIVTYHTASIKISFETALRPGIDGLIEGVLSSEGGTVGCLGVLIASLRGGGTVGTGSLGRNVVSEEVGSVLADKSSEFIDLGTLRN